MSQYTVRFYNETNDPGEELVKEVEVDKGSTVPGDEFPEESITWTGFERNSDIARIYGTLGIDDVHEIVAEWYYKETADGDWILFDDTVAVNRDIDVYANIKMATVVLTAPDYSRVPFTAEVPYNSTIRAMDSFKDFIFINEGVARQAYNAAEEKVLQKLVDKGLLDNTTDKNILNQHRYIRFIKVLGEATANEIIDEFVGGGSNPDKLAAIAEFKREFKEEEQITVNSDNLFIFEPILSRAEKYNYNFIKSKIPAKVLPYLPMDAIEEIFNRHYNAYVDEFKAAVDNARANPGTDYYIASGFWIHINPVSDIFEPALNHALSVKPIIEGKLATSAQLGTYYHYYEANPYKDSYEQFMTVGNWFNGADNGYLAVESGYSLKSFDDYYGLVKAFADLLDDGLSWFYDDANVPEADREAVYDVVEARILNLANFFNNIIVDYATNGLPTTFEEFVTDIESDPEMLTYLNKFGLTAYLDKIINNDKANKVTNSAIEKFEEKFGAKIEALLDKYAASKLNRVYDEGEYNKAKETLHGLLTKNDGEFYTVDTLFDLFVKGDYKSVTKKNITVEVSRAWLID